MFLTSYCLILLGVISRLCPSAAQATETCMWGAVGPRITCFCTLNGNPTRYPQVANEALCLMENQPAPAPAPAPAQAPAPASAPVSAPAPGTS